jgi:anthranilate phosphoribosyltransferase
MNPREALAIVSTGGSLDRSQSRRLFASALHPDTDPMAVAGLLAAMAQRGETVAEIAGAVDALREVMIPFEHPEPGAIDTAGTGGDGLGTFNLSTAAALVAAAAGARVIKHGNRSVSSKCGSADLVEAAGVVLELPPEAAAQVLDEVGITFLFAPLYHPTMRFVAPVRRALGVRTIFNFLGPLCNPGRVRRQLLGVSARERVADFAAVLRELGHERALVVCGGGGADELTLLPGAELATVGEVPGNGFDAAGIGMQESPLRALAGGAGAADNLQILWSVINGATGPIRDATCLNAAAALVVAGLASDGAEGVQVAREAIDTGAAAAKLRAWVRASHRVAQKVAV